MARVIAHKFGKLVKVADHKGVVYQDWRAEYIGKPGLIVLCESINKSPGKKFIYMFTASEPEELMQDYFHTSCGECEMDEESICITTNNSTYEFEIGDFGMTEEDKLLLMLNVRFN